MKKNVLKNKLTLMVIMFFAMVAVLVACGSDEPSTDAPGGNDVAETQANDDNGVADETTPSDDEVAADPIADPFEAIINVMEQHGLQLEVENNDAILEGGHLRFALGSTAELTGLFETVFTRFTTESDLRRFTHELLLFEGLDFNPSNTNSLASAYADRESRTITITKNVESYWADGVPLTLDDLLFAYEVINHPDYTGPRRDANMRNVVGTQAFHDGDADYISGLTLSEDGMELVIEFYEITPFTIAGGFWALPMPRHHWEGIAVADMEDHPNARHNVLGNGPFKIESTVPGESFLFVRNPYFWRGEANLDSVEFVVVDPMLAPEAMRAGMFDVINFPQSQFTEANRGMDNIQFLSNPWNNNTSFWLNFRMGDWDEEEGVVVPWDEPRLSVAVREALALSMNHLGAGQYLFNGLVVPAGSVYWPTRRLDWIDRSLPTFNNFDLDRANQILDDAGYTERDSDGFRMRPDGTPLVVTYAAQTGSQANIDNRHLELETWRYDLGVNVVLFNDVLVANNVFWDALEIAQSNEIDMFTAGTYFGSNPTPNWTGSPWSANNHTRYTNPDWEYAFHRFGDERMWDPEFVFETAQLWERTVSEARVLFPTTTALGLTAVNNRVANFSVANNDGNNEVPGLWNTWMWGLTAEETIPATN